MAENSAVALWQGGRLYFGFDLSRLGGLDIDRPKTARLSHFFKISGSRWNTRNRCLSPSLSHWTRRSGRQAPGPLVSAAAGPRWAPRSIGSHPEPMLVHGPRLRHQGLCFSWTSLRNNPRQSLVAWNHNSSSFPGPELDWAVVLSVLSEFSWQASVGAGPGRDGCDAGPFSLHVAFSLDFFTAR